jgi:hypothetical protein
MLPVNHEALRDVISCDLFALDIFLGTLFPDSCSFRFYETTLYDHKKQILNYLCCFIVNCFRKADKTIAGYEVNIKKRFVIQFKLYHERNFVLLIIYIIFKF